MNDETEKLINKCYATPNTYHNFPQPLLITLESDWSEGWTYTRALCPVKDCKYDGLPQGFNQHYARAHEPDQWRQRAKRVLRVLDK